MLDAIKSLGTLWNRIQDQGSTLDATGGLNAASRLSEWIDGRDIPLGDQKQNILTMPMTVISQIVQYFNYLERAGTDIHHASVLESVAAGGGIQGFCAGLLSALAVASGSTEEEIGSFAGMSIKLAFAVGAFIDLDQNQNGGNSKFSTLAVRWRTPITLDNCHRVLRNHLEVSVLVRSVLQGR
jgi:hypothetical protein